jgi:hypothetical protein
MSYRVMSLRVLIAAAALALVAKFANGATLDRACSITAPGGACMFTVRAAATGNLSVSTRACVRGQRWRTVIAKINTGETVSQVGTGNAAAFTGRAVRSAAKGANFLVIVSFEWPAPENFSGAVVTRFTGPFATVLGPRPNAAVGLPPLPDCSAHPSLVTAGDRGDAQAGAVFAAPLLPSPLATNTLLPPTTVLLSPAAPLGTAATGF